jgi:NADH-quinone oxidoreductase subunit A
MIPYETGQDPASTPRTRFSVRFYRIAILFLVFDLEAAFFYPWAVLFRELSCEGGSVSPTGVCTTGATPLGFLVMVVFMAILVLALLYVWRKKALEWE